MSSTTNQYRPQEGIAHESTTAAGTHGQPQFTNSFGSDQPQFTNSFAPGQTEAQLENPIGSPDDTRERSGSRDYSTTDEWDASKVPPSRFQQRKGSIYSTQGSRDGHVQRNKDRDTGFHETHTKLFGKAKEKVKEASDKVSGHRRASSSGSATKE